MSEFKPMRPWLSVAALALTLTFSASGWSAGEQHIVDDAKALGKTQAQTQNSALKNGSATAAVSSTNPDYTATPPQTQYYSSKDLVSPAQAQAADCKAKPDDAVCAGISAGTAQRPASNVTFGDPALTGQAVGANPTLILGEIAQTYNACSIGGMPVGAGSSSGLSCSLDTGPWSNYLCEKYLNVETQTKYSCNAGSQFDVHKYLGPSSDWIEVRAICDPLAGNTITFQMHAEGTYGSCDGWSQVALDLSQPRPQGEDLPELLPGLLPNYASGCKPIQVYWEGQGCANKACRLNFHFVDGLTFQKHYGCTGAGEITGDHIQFWTGYTTPGEPVASCYAPYPTDISASPLTGYWGVSDSGAFAYWARTGPSVYQGYTASGTEVFVAPFAFTQPTLTTVPGSTMVNTCQSYEAITALLPADGVNLTSTPVIPALGAIDAPQCVRTSSTCLEGASTKVIDGVPVTKDCWRYANEFACTTLVKPSTCSDPTFKACAPRSDPVCLKDDGAGHCVQAARQMECKAGDPQYTPAINCGNQSYCAGGSCYDTTYAPNQDFSYTVSQMEAHAEAGSDFDDKAMQIFKGTDNRCSRDNFGFSDCCGGSSVTTCSDAEKALQQKRDAGLCHQVGSYCSNGNIFGCYKTSETYCCFSSLLGRLIQEQGRDQMGKSWGAPKTPDCSGFTPDELAKLDWSAFDLTEYYAHISPALLNNSTSTQNAADKQQSCYWGEGRC